MEERDPKPITINDILDQITKTPATPIPKPIIPVTQTLKPQAEIKLPSLGKISEKESPSSQSIAPTESKLKLSIRTMASDLEKLRKGQKPLGEEVGKDITLQKPVQQTPQTIPKPPVTATLTPKPPEPTQPIAERHYHPEKVISGELPAFLDANPPKKVTKPQEERVEYRLIAKVISSGLTTGVVSTIVVALLVYFVISYFFFNQEEVIIATPTPVSTSPTPTAEINEINAIFSDTFALDFQLPEQRENTTSNLKSFINNQVLGKKQFLRLNITDQTKQTVSSEEILRVLTASFPPELENYTKNDNAVLVYGQEELLTIDSSSDKRLVFIVEISDDEKVLEIIKKWETTLPNDLKEILDLDVTKESTRNFLNNERHGVQILYKNFPLPDRSIDYSIVSSLTGRKYLIITNSRESMYSPADKIRGF